MPFDKDGYPTEDTLDTIKNWPVNPLNEKRLKDFITYVRDHWQYPDQIKYNPETGCLEMHTVGWSGNESIIGSLQDNFFFWGLFWYKSKRGGHFWLELFCLDEAGKRAIPKEVF